MQAYENSNDEQKYRLLIKTAFSSISILVYLHEIVYLVIFESDVSQVVQKFTRTQVEY